MAGFTSQMVSEALLSRMTDVIAMTRGHAQMLVSFFPSQAAKIRTIGDYLPDGPADIPDPIGQGIDAYRMVGLILDKAIPNIIRMPLI